ncbi:MAG: DUF5602 domain-containing protein [Deltaproteobacteria bacterium]|nr:DUF5602 domain-containing protein [Deltaproteobacteria bacterium]
MSDPGTTVRRSLVTLLGVALIAVFISEGFAQGTKAGTYLGNPETLGNGTARSFVTLDKAGKPTAIGVILSETALSGLPSAEPEYEYMLPLPKEAEVTGYNHIAVNWNPKGHPPPGVYTVPHFDFHFYLISPEERNKITATGDDLERAHKAPAPEFAPKGYILPPGTEVPRMGAHMVNPAAPEFQKKPFARTFIYGFYDGQMIFVEPMATKTFLESKPSVRERISVPQAYPRSAYYPTRYVVKYDPSSKALRVSLEGLVRRDGKKAQAAR